jgi:hypothetical protein
VNRPYLNAALPNRLLQLESSAAYNLVVDLDINAVRADSELTGAQIVYVLTAINSEV